MSPSNAVTECLRKTLGRCRKVPPYFFVQAVLFLAARTWCIQVFSVPADKVVERLFLPSAFPHASLPQYSQLFAAEGASAAGPISARY
jgi:hypothetical protein